MGDTFNEFYIECECGNEVLRVGRDEDDNTVYIGLYHAEFYKRQFRFWETAWERMKHAFYVLMGWDYPLFDIVIDGEQYDEFKDFVNSP